MLQAPPVGALDGCAKFRRVRNFWDCTPTIKTRVSSILALLASLGLILLGTIILLKLVHLVLLMVNETSI
jgi:hypothetical protein